MLCQTYFNKNEFVFNLVKCLIKIHFKVPCYVIKYFNKNEYIFNLISCLIKIHFKILIITSHVHDYSNNEHIIKEHTISKNIITELSLAQV